MKALLAEKLLAKVMNWSPEDVARERPLLQAFADFKYDSYQLFSPGMRFVESLALWLKQFTSNNERQIAYDFIKKRLIFFSHEEMAHFASIVYPDFIRPELIAEAAKTQRIPEQQITRIIQTEDFQRLQEATLFLGLSDGARIDQFRRANQDLSHEQIFLTHDLTPPKLKEIASRLRKTPRNNPLVRAIVLLKEIGSRLRKTHRNDPLVRAIVLLDDFSASGRSYFRKEGKNFTGKIFKFLDSVHKEKSWRRLVHLPETVIIIALYVATETAVQHILEAVKDCLGEKSSAVTIKIVQPLHKKICLTPDSPEKFVDLVEKYYDDSLMDEHAKKGGTKDLKYGFFGCGLPLILHHNSPNNSLFLLWVEEGLNVRALFPRISRHRGEA